MMRVLKSKHYRRMPWRNGQGETAEVAIGPVGGTIDDFNWRVSMAHINGDGPFSIFPDTDRTLAVLVGNGLHLSIDGNAQIDLTRDSEPLVFPGDVAVSATLLDGGVTDLNVMTHRGPLKHSVRRVRVHGSVELAAAAPLALLVCAQASVEVEVNARMAKLATLDTLLVEETPSRLRVVSDTLALIYLIQIQASEDR